MELSELGILFATEGADAAISKMEEFHAASVAVIQTDEERVKAAGKVTSATAALSDQINRSILGYAGSKSLIYEYTAAQLGANDALQSQIEFLKELEMHARLANEAAAEGKREAREKAAAEKAAAREALKLEQDKWDALIKTAEARARDVRLYTQQEQERVAVAKKAEQDIADAKNAAVQRAVTERQKQIDLYIKQEKERVAEEKRTADQLAAEAKKSADAAIKAAEQKVISEISWAKKSRDEQLRIKDEIAAYKAGGVSDSTIGTMFGSAAINGTVKEVGNLAEKWDHVTLNTSRARSEMVVLAHEALQGRFSRIPASMMVFAEYTDLTSLALSGAGLAVMGLVAALVLLSIGMVKGMLEQRDMQNALITTGNYAGMTADGLNSAAHAAVAMGGSLSSAKAVVIDLASSGKYTGEQIGTISKAVILMEHATGDGEESVKALTKAFESLQVEANAHSRYSDEVTKATLKLDSQYHFLTVSVLAQIRALEDEGKSKEASILATNEFAKVTEQRAKEIVANLGFVQVAWRKVKEVIGETTDAVNDFGKTDSAARRVEELTKELERYKAGDFFGTSGDQIARVSAELAQAQKELMRQQDRALEQGEKTQKNSLAVNALAMIEIESTHLKADKMSQLEKATEAYHNRLEAIRKAGYSEKDTKQLDPEVIAAHEKALEEKYKEKTKRVKENSEVELNQYVKSQNLQISTASQTAEKLIAIEQGKFSTKMKLENDNFDIARNNAKRETDLGFLSADAYMDHAERMKVAAQELADIKVAAYKKEEEAGKKATDNIIEREEAFTAKTAEGQARRAAAIATAQDKQAALHQKLADKIEAAQEAGKNASAKAESDAYKDLDTDMNKVIDTLTKKLGVEEKTLRNLKLTKEQSADLFVTERDASILRLETELAVAEAKATTFEINEEELKFYNTQIEKLKIIIGLHKQSRAAQEGIAEEESAKLATAAWKKGWEDTNKFAKSAFDDWAERGVSFADSLGKALKKSILNAIYESTFKPIALQVYTSLVGTPTGAAGTNAVNLASGGSTLGSIGSTLSTIGGLASTFGSSLAAGFSGTMSAGFTGMSAVLEGGLSQIALGTSSTMAAGLGQIVGALGPYALAAVAVYGLLGGFKGEYVKGAGSATLGFDSNGATTSKNQFGNSFDFQTDQADSYVKTLADSYSAIAKGLGIKNAGGAFAFGSNNSDGGKFGVNVAVGSTNYAVTDVKATKENLELEAGRAVLAALQGSELPGYLAKVFNSISASTATAEQLNATLEYAQALKLVRTQLTETRTPLQILKDDMAAAFVDLGTNADSFKTDFVAAIDAGIGKDALGKWVSLGTAMAATAAEADKLAKTNASLQDKLDVLTGAQTERSLELRDATDDSTKAILKQIYAQEDLKTAAEEAADAAKKWADEVEALNKIAKEMEDARVKKAKEDLAAVEDLRSQATDNYLKAQERVSTAQQKLADVLHKAVDSFQDVLDGLDGGRSPEESKAGALRTVQELEARIRGGDTSAWDKMPKAIKAFVDLSAQTSGTLIEYRRDEAYAKALLKEGIAAGNAQIKLLPVEMQKATDPIKAAYEELAKATKEEEAARVLAIAMQASLTSTEKSLGDKYLEAIKAMPDAKALDTFYNNTLKAASDAAKVASDAAAASALILAGMTKPAATGGGSVPNVGPLPGGSGAKTDGPQPPGLPPGAGAASPLVTEPTGPTAGAGGTKLDDISSGYGSIVYSGEGNKGISTDIFGSGFVRIYTSDGLHFGTTELYARLLESIVKSDGKGAALAAADSYGIRGGGLDMLRKALPGASFKIGSNYIPFDMPAMVHEGEEITPRPFVDMQREAREETNRLLGRLLTENQELRIDIGKLQTRLESINDHVETTADALNGATKSNRPVAVKLIA